MLGGSRCGERKLASEFFLSRWLWEIAPNEQVEDVFKVILPGQIGNIIASIVETTFGRVKESDSRFRDCSIVEPFIDDAKTVGELIWKRLLRCILDSDFAKVGGFDSIMLDWDLIAFAGTAI